jgi:hypothetical protein
MIPMTQGFLKKTQGNRQARAGILCKDGNPPEAHDPHRRPETNPHLLSNREYASKRDTSIPKFSHD